MGKAPLWYLVKIVADWHNCSVQEAWKLPYKDWLRVYTANEAEAMAQAPKMTNDPGQALDLRQLRRGRG